MRVLALLVVSACGSRARPPEPKPKPKPLAPSDLEPQWGRVCYRGTARDTAGNSRDVMIAHVVDPSTAMITQVWVVTDAKLAAAIPPRWESQRTIQFVVESEHAFEVHENAVRHGRGNASGPTWWWTAWAYRIAIDDVDPSPRALVRATASINRYEQHTSIPSQSYAETVTATWVSCTEFKHDL